jgi:hypothetical protein
MGGEQGEAEDWVQGVEENLWTSMLAGAAVHLHQATGGERRRRMLSLDVQG